MSTSPLTPTEALLHVAKSRPYFPAIRAGNTHWSYAALWNRIRQLSGHIDYLVEAGLPVGLYTNLEVDYVAGAHAIWLAGRTVVFLNPRWSETVVQTICNRTGLLLVLYGSEAPPDMEGIRAVSTHSLVSAEPPAFCPAPLASETVDMIPEIASIIPGASDTEVPRSIVFPMRKALGVLSAESSAYFKARDAQWLQGSSTSIRPLFEIRRFMFNQSTLHLDASPSVPEQCAALFLELESSRHGQPLRVYFTINVFRAFCGYVHSQVSSLPSWIRVYWVILEGEGISTQDIANARGLFPQATVVCDYARSEFGFAGAVQCVIRPEEPVLPAAISYTPSNACQDLVLLDNSHRVMPIEDGASGVIGIVTSDSGAYYLDEPQPSAYTFRALSAEHVLIYTDDLGRMTSEGRIMLTGRMSRKVVSNDMEVDLDSIENMLSGIFCSPFSSVTDFKLVKAPNADRIVLFYTGANADLEVLKDARDELRQQDGDSLALSISTARHLERLPLTESDHIDVIKLETWVDEELKKRRASRAARASLRPLAKAPPLPVPAIEPAAPATSARAKKVAEEIAAEVAKLCNLDEPIPIDASLTMAGLNSITATQLFFWMQGKYDYEDELTKLLDEKLTAEMLAKDIFGETNRYNVSAEQQLATYASPAAAEFSQNLMEVEEAPRPVTILITAPETKPVDPSSNVWTVNPNPISSLFLSWMTNLIWLGFKRPLQAKDLYNMPPRDTAETVQHWTDKYWVDFDAYNSGRTEELPRLFRSIFSSARRFLIISGLLWFLSIAAGVFTPLFIQQIIIVAGAGPEPKGNPEAIQQFQDGVKAITGGIPLFVDSIFANAGILFGMKILFTLTGRASDQMVKRLALNVRTTLSAAIYQKSLRLSAHGLQKYSKGYVLNLANVDTESVSKAVDIVHLTWGIPLQLITVIVLLNRILGVSVWAGVGALTVGVVMLVSIVPIFMAKSAPMVLRIGDRRIKMIKEILDGMKLIKIRGWESLFLARVEAVRSEQLRYLKMFDIGIALFVMVGQFSNILMPIAALSLFGDESGGVTAAKIFPALSFFGFLVDPLLSLPQTLSLFNLATASWTRIYQFLSAKEAAAPSDVAHAVYTDPIRIIDGCFAWPEKVQAGPPRGPPPKKAAPKSEAKVSNPEKPLMPKTHLKDVNISVKQGSLTAIVGSVGSGKSSLMSAILGEMQVVSGKVFCNGSVAYCPQQPWIQSCTVQENILFGKPMDVHQLEFALDAASFRADLDRLPNGIGSEIAENGGNLSGGQKARLSLARAVYADADVYVLDDVLAALDPRVSRLVFQKCILEALHGKTRLFVTHQLQYLNQVDHIIVVSEGTVVEQGSYAELFAKDGEFKRLVSHLEHSPTQKAKLGKTPSQQAKQKAEKKVEKKPQPKPSGGSIIAAEDSGSITLHTWWSYIKAMGGVPTLLLLALLICLFQGSIVVMNQWLSWWSRGKFQETVVFWIEVYDGIGAGSVFAVVSLNTCILLGVVRASRNFHSMAMSGLLSAPMWWFETQPTGRILNRFGKDVASIDQRLLPQLYALIASTGSCLSASVILGISAPVILGVIGGLMVVYAIVFMFYRRSIRELKRLEATERSPLQSQLSETLDGIPTIAAYKREGDFNGSANGLLDKSNKPIFLRNSAEIWVTIRMELLSSLIVLAVAMLGETSVVSASHLGVALSYSNAFTYILNLLIKSAANIESEMNSVDRLLEYTERLPKEHPAHLETDPVEGMWPSRGEIVFKDLEASYPSRPERPVLKNVNLKFVPGETVFIVGRTGSGKSTLLSILLRLIEIGKGKVEVDGEDISNLGVATLRRGMELIPQEPFIFAGTIRTALDFEGRFDDTKLWNALELVGLKTTISNMSDKLDTVVSDNGSNFSVGQRQLLCLAGAILRDPKILLLDEATSSLDSGADVFLLKTVRANCPNATVMSVMHRLSDKLLEQCDKVLVMDEGTPAEFDSPQALLARPDSIFAKLMEATRQ